MGKGPSGWILKDSQRPLPDVHRIKVDVKADFAILTLGAGGIVVKSLIDQRELLWDLPMVGLTLENKTYYSTNFFSRTASDPMRTVNTATASSFSIDCPVKRRFGASQ